MSSADSMPSALRTASRWIVGERDAPSERVLVERLGIPSLLAATLASRGYRDPAAAEAVLNPTLAHLHDPRLLPDFDPALDAILGAKERGDLIFIHGDYDVDGVTSTALFSRFLTKIGCRVHTHVPHRMKHGYGVHVSAVQEANRLGAKLLLTCDCGASAIDEVEAAREFGMDVVVTDHHTLGERMPRAHAVVNPHREDSRYPFSGLSGAGVVLKLCAGITEALGHPVEGFYRAYLDLATLGTIADVMPLVDENRIIARFGLPLLAESKKPGIRALLRESKLEERVALGMRSHHVSFGLGPRLNAAGRLEDAALALDLLLAQEDAHAAKLAREIEDLNEKRRAEQDSLFEQALLQIEETGQAENCVIVVAEKGWHPGLIGIVASKVLEQFHRPVFVASIDPVTGTLKASGRSIRGFHLANAIRSLPDLMSGGGHALAAGFTSHVSKLDGIRHALNRLAAEELRPEDLVPTICADFEALPEELDFRSVESLSMLEPFGLGNREPVFFIPSLTLLEVRATRNPDHPRVLLASQGQRPVFAPAFGMGSRLAGIPTPVTIDALVQVAIEEWQGERSVRWTLKDLRPAEAAS